MPQPFTRADLARARVTLLRDGRWANACVSRVEIDGVAWTLKDFSGRSGWVRLTLARFLLARELRALARLRGIEGVPGEAFRVDAGAIAARFVPGDAVGGLDDTRITPDYLIRLEALMRAVHERGIVHLDTRGGGNILCSPAGEPGIIDFQAGFSTRWMPGGLRRVVEAIDMSGVYKKWLKHQPAAMGEARRAEFERINRLRRFWVLRGYLGKKK